MCSIHLTCCLKPQGTKICCPLRKTPLGTTSVSSSRRTQLALCSGNTKPTPRRGYVRLLPSCCLFSVKLTQVSQLNNVGFPLILLDRLAINGCWLYDLCRKGQGADWAAKKVMSAAVVRHFARQERLMRLVLRKSAKTVFIAIKKPGFVIF